MGEDDSHYQSKINKEENLAINTNSLTPIANKAFVLLFYIGIRPIGVFDDISVGEVGISDKPFFHI
ncbi:hypothetical protein PHSC3_001659 [Chlamydiales bacterium STE3]|nr:hypothetical protein PHSC3_001659 [Chlamydiales bacterium STE3]